MAAATQTAHEVVEDLRAFIADAAAKSASTEALNPGHRVPFHWPPHPISYKYHIHASDWTGRASVRIHGEDFEVEVARTPHGVFGRCPALWHEARGDDLDDLLRNLVTEAEPLFARQFAISETLGRQERFAGSLRELKPSELMRLLYCRDRDVANEARSEIEKRASSKIFFPAMIEVLRDQRHPLRRSAQWCVLDLLEDMPSFVESEADEREALSAIRDLLWTAPDDHARTMYKAGVVVGGHLPDEHGGPVLIECLQAPSKIGRRSAIHGLFHVVEWHPAARAEVVAALRKVAESDSEPLLRSYANDMARDIEAGTYDHVPEPVFPEEE